MTQDTTMSDHFAGFYLVFVYVFCYSSLSEFSDSKVMICDDVDATVCHHVNTSEDHDVLATMDVGQFLVTSFVAVELQ